MLLVFFYNPWKQNFWLSDVFKDIESDQWYELGQRNKDNIYFAETLNLFRAKPTKWSNTFKQFVGKSRRSNTLKHFVGKNRRIFWVWLTISRVWRLNGKKSWKFDSFLEDLQNICSINPLSANPTKCSNTLKQFVGKLRTNCLSVFDHFVGLALKGLRSIFEDLVNSPEYQFHDIVFRDITKDCRRILTEASSEPYQTSKMEPFGK